MSENPIRPNLAEACAIIHLLVEGDRGATVREIAAAIREGVDDGNGGRYQIPLLADYIERKWGGK